MTWQRVQNILYHAPDHVSGVAKLVLVGIADRTGGKNPRIPEVVEMSIGDLMICSSASERGVRKAIEGLADDGIDVRVPIGKDKNGRMVYACRGRVPKWCLPYFHAAAGCKCPACWMSAHLEGGTTVPPSSAEGGTTRPEGGTFRQEGGTGEQEGGTPVPPLLKPTNQPTESVAQWTEPQCRLPSTPKRGEDSPPNPKAEELLRRSGHDLAASDRAVVLAAVNRALTDGHREQAIADALSAPIGGLNHPGLGLAGRLAPDKLGPPPLPPVPGSMTHDQARKQPPCEHGRPGGHILNASCGLPWCPTCRGLAIDNKPYGPAAEPAVEKAVRPRDVAGLISGAVLSDSAPSDDVRAAAAIKAGCCPTCYLAGQSVVAVPDVRYCRAHAV
jgi:hypothetical protein